MHRARPTTQRRFQWSAPSLPTSSGARLKNQTRSEEHTSELQSQSNLVCRLLLEKKKIFLNVQVLEIGGHQVLLLLLHRGILRHVQNQDLQFTPRIPVMVRIFHCIQAAMHPTLVS